MTRSLPSTSPAEMSSWDTPSAVSAGGKPKSQSPQNRNCPAGEGITHKPKEASTNQRQRSCLHQTTVRAYAGCSPSSQVEFVEGLHAGRIQDQFYEKGLLNSSAPRTSLLGGTVGRHSHTHSCTPPNAQHPLTTTPAHTAASHRLTSPWGKFKPNVVELFSGVPVERREFYAEETISLL